MIARIRNKTVKHSKLAHPNQTNDSLTLVREKSNVMVRNVLLANLLTVFSVQLFGQQLSDASSSMQNSIWGEPDFSLGNDTSPRLDLGFAPNPFSGEILIDLNVPEAGKVSLKVFDILGQQVATITEEYFRSGRHKLKFSGDELPAGRYYLHLAANRKVVIKQVLKKN